MLLYTTCKHNTFILLYYPKPLKKSISILAWHYANLILKQHFWLWTVRYERGDMRIKIAPGKFPGHEIFYILFSFLAIMSF